MRRHLLAIFSAAMCSAAFTANADGLNAEFQWMNTLWGEGVSSNIGNITLGPDGDFYVGGHVGVIAGKNLAPSAMKWSDTDIMPAGGVTYDFQNDGVITRIAADGSTKWCIVPNHANFSSNTCYLAQTPDGGVVLATNATFNKNGAEAPLLVKLSDTKGRETTINWEGTPEGKAPYTGLLIKFSAEGELMWHKLVSADVYADADNTLYVGTPITISGVATDADGNIFIAGSHITPVDFGNGVTLPMALNATITGNKAPTNTDAFIAKFDGDGNALKALTNTGTAPYATKDDIKVFTVANGKLYCAALATALEGTSYTFLGVPAEISETIGNNIVYAEVDCGTLECTRAAALSSAYSTTNTSGTPNVQLKHIEAIDGDLYINGSINAAIEQNGVIIAQATAKQVQAATVSVNIETFNATHGYIYDADGISGDYYTIADKKAEKLYVYGYGMSNGSPCALHVYNLADGSLIENAVLCKGGSSFAAAFNPATKQFVCTAYGKSLSQIAGAPDGFTDPTFTENTGFMLCFKLPDVDGANASIETIAATDIAGAPVEYFNLQGIRVANPTPGTLVIRRQGSEAKKVVVNHN